MAPDLVLVGLERGRPNVTDTSSSSGNANSDGGDDAGEQLEIARLELELGSDQQPVLLYVHPTGRQVSQFDQMELLEMMSWGITHRVVEHVHMSENG